MTIVETDFGVALDRWGKATVDVLRKGFVLGAGSASDEVVSAEASDAFAAVARELVDVIGAEEQEIIAHAVLGLRALAYVLDDAVATRLEPAALHVPPADEGWDIGDEDWLAFYEEEEE